MAFERTIGFEEYLERIAKHGWTLWHLGYSSTRRCYEASVASDTEGFSERADGATPLAAVQAAMKSPKRAHLFATPPVSAIPLELSRKAMAGQNRLYGLLVKALGDVD